MAVSLQAGSVASYDGVVGTPNLWQDLSVTVSAGADLALFLVVFDGYNIDSSGAGGFFNVPTVDGSNMTLVDTIGGGANNTSAIYRMLGVSAGTRTVRASVAAWAGQNYSLTAFACSGVDQTTPTGTVVKTSLGVGTSPQSSACTVAAGGIALASRGISDGSQNITKASGETDVRAAIAMSGQGYLLSYRADATAMGYSWAAGGLQTHQIIVPINPSAGGGGGGSTGRAAMSRIIGLGGRNAYGNRR